MQKKRAIRKGAVTGAIVLTLVLCVGCTVESPTTTNTQPATSQQQAPVTSTYNEATYIDVVSDDEGYITIAEDALSHTATLLNYDAGGTVVQLIALLGTDGTPRIACNTCQSCTPSPKAYFKQKGDVLECQNCGLEFSVDTVGEIESSGGCNPMPLSEVTRNDGKLRVRTDEVAQMASVFATWEGEVRAETKNAS